MAPSLNLPPPTNGAPDNAAMDPSPAPSQPKFSSGGIIFPPPDIRTTVDKTADFVARVGPSFEAKIKTAESNNPKFSFLNPDDPYHSYYQQRIQAAKNGETQSTPPAAASQGAQPAAAASDAAPADQPTGDEGQRPEEPEPLEFSADLPNITAIDLDIIKLTALFTARKGRSFASALQAREARSFQFEFLRPSHSFYGYFNRLVEQYEKVMHPPKELLKKVKLGAYGTTDEPPHKRAATGAGCGGARPQLLQEAKKRAEFEKWAREKRKKADELEKQQKAAFDEIDWQDFVVVGTVELTDADQHIDLPPPRSLRDFENMTMAQKKMAAMIMETEAEGLDGQEEVEELEMAGSSKARAFAKKVDDEDMEMEMDNSSDEGEADASAAKVQATTMAEEVKRPDGPATIRIRKDYVPRGIAGRQKGPQMTQCPVCGEQIAVDEMAEHVRFELLNPKYREQRAELEAKKAQQATLQAGADPTHFLRQFASSRTDIFGTETEEAARARREAEERRLAREKEKIIWDGHARSKEVAKDMYQKNKELEEQMNQLHRKPQKVPAPSYGPQFPVPEAGDADGGAAVSTPLAPPPPGSGLPPRPLLPGEVAPTPLPQPPLSSSSMHPSRLAALTQGAMEASTAMAGQKRPAETEASGQPPSQRTAVEGGGGGGGASSSASPTATPLTKPSDGGLHAESAWLAAHPESVRVKVRIPMARTVTPHADGAVHEFEIAPTASMGSIRDWVHATVLQSQIGASKLKLRVAGKPATLKSTAAAWNLQEGDEVEVVLGK
ncbi:SF3a splicing factor complex subunit [Thecaphora frezii]